MVRHVVIALVVLLAALLGFALGFLVTSFLGIFGTASSECDGPCFRKWDEVFWVAVGVGVLSAVGFGLAGRSLTVRALARQADRRTIRRLAKQTRRDAKPS